MKTRPCWIVINVRPHHGAPRVKRVAQTWPTIDVGEVAIRIQFELPDALANPPLTVTELEERDLTVGVYTVAPEPVES